MTPADAVEVLTVAAAFDRRTIGVTDGIAWADALAGLDPKECAYAVRAHYGETTEWLMPAHVRRRVALARAKHAERNHTDGVVRMIESAKSGFNPQASHAAYLSARRAFDEALRAKKERDAQPETDAEEASS